MRNFASIFPSSFAIVLFVVFLNLQSFGQSKKKESNPKNPSSLPVNPPVQMEKMDMRPIDEKKNTATEKEGDYIFFVVFANPNDGSNNLLNELPKYFPGMEMYGLSTSPQAQLVRSRSGSMELFKRAFGSSLQVFSDSDLEVYGQSLPCFSQIREEVMSIASKFSK
jgi:hypothetical protein